jgi:hypothetical protein
MKTLFDFNKIHSGETIYIIGGSPAILDLTQDEVDFLKDKPTIAINMSYEGFRHAKYCISAHISNAVYLYEYAKNSHIFIDYGSPIKKQAFGYLKEVWSSPKVTTFISSPEVENLSFKKNKTDVSLNGHNSCLLLATHLAYIMGANRVVYIGFDQSSKAHFWNYNSEIENRIVNNIKSILESRKYFSSFKYQSGKTSSRDRHLNAHIEFETLFGLHPSSSGSVFFLKENQLNETWYHKHISSQQAQTQRLQKYIAFLHSKNITTFTHSNAGITVDAGCKTINKKIHELNI